MRRLAVILLALAALVALPLMALAQSGDDAQKSAFLKFVQDRLSTPERQISISNIDGALSSDASIREITVADTKGVYLKIENVALNWNQAAIFLGRLEINSLTAGSIDYLRNPVAGTEPGPPPSPEATGISVPQLPVAVVIKKLTVPRITFGEQVFGLGSAISLDGSVTLDGGSLQSSLAVKRLDGPGGGLTLAAGYDKASTKLDLDLGITEPPNGIIANLLDIEGRPDIQLRVTGTGPVGALQTRLTLDAGGARALDGTASVTQQPQGFAIDASLGGPIATLVAPAYRDFFGARTTLAAKGLLRNTGGIALDQLSLKGGQLSLTGTAATSSDWFLDDLHLRGEVANASGDPVLLPVAGAGTKIREASLAVDFGGTSQNWQGKLAVRGFDNGALTADALTLDGSGVAVSLDDPAARRVTFNVDGALTGVGARDPEIAAALGDTIGLGAAGLWNAGEPMQLAQFRLAGKSVSLNASGSFANAVFTGDLAVAATSLSPFAGLAGRPLAGALDLKAKGSIPLLTGGFDLDVDGTGSNLAIGDQVADRLLQGTVRLTGGVARTASGVSARNFRLANDQVQLTADGSFASTSADFRFDMALADLGLLSPEAKGALSVTGTAKGQDGRIALDLGAKIPRGSLLQRPLDNAALTLGGTLDAGAFSGALRGTGSLGGQPVELSSKLSTGESGNRLTDLSFSAGGTTLTGDLAQGSGGLYTGKLALVSSNLATAAALALVEASGSAGARIELAAENGRQTATVAARVKNLKAAGISIDSADIAAGISDLFGVPKVNGTLSGSGMAAAGVSVATIKANAKWSGERTDFDAAARLAAGTDLALAGSLAPVGQGYRLALDRVSLTQGALAARLAAPAAIAVDGDRVTLDNVRFNVGSGSLTASGTAGRALDVTLALKALPLAAANAVSPGLGLAGTLDGTARITGSGSAPLASFRVTGAGIGAAAINGLGIAPLSLSADGDYRAGTVGLQALSAQSPGGLRIGAKGSVPLSGSGLDLAVTGTAPLALANRFVVDRGGQATGTAEVSARVTGSLADPRVAGKVTVAGGGYTDPLLNLRLVGIAGSATLAGQTVTIDRLGAGISTGGSLSASGSVSLKPGYAADLRLALNHARYVDQSLLVATASGNLTMTGPMATAPLIGGTIRIEKADITVPSALGGGAADIKVRHVDPPPAVARSLARATPKTAARSGPHGAGGGPRLDLALSAPNQIFIRGRGLDVEMGGAVRLTGALDDIQPVGGFDLIRGRLSILGQRLNFTSGTVRLTGDLDPEINLAATIPSDDLSVGVTVSGRASDPKIDFTSSPTLPQDEVLSRLLFKQGVTQLSPLQLARLAGAASELAGGSGSSLLDSLRSSTGLDDLDLVTDAEGNTAVSAGRYVTDNIYIRAQAGANGQTKATVNLDITPSLKASASSGSDGDSGVGVFYEQDY